jgi:hypothetical protein
MESTSELKVARGAREGKVTKMRSKAATAPLIG